MVDSLYFLHIPKTAGTSFTNYLDRQFPSESIFPYQLWSDYAEGPYFECDEASRDYYRLYRGHFGLGFAADTGKSPTVVTFLRDPVQQLRSLFNHMMIDRANGTELHPGLDTNTNSLAAYLAPASNRMRLANFQSRYLRSTIDRSTIEAGHLAGGSFFAPLVDNHPDPTMLTDAAAAIDFVGVQEYFAESLILLCLQLGLGVPQIEHLYVRKMELAQSTDRHAVPGGVQDTLEDAVEDQLLSITTVDRELHERHRLRIAERFDKLVLQLTGVKGTGLVNAKPQERSETVEQVLDAIHRSPEAAQRRQYTQQTEPVTKKRFGELRRQQTVSLLAGAEARVSFEFTNQSTQSYFGYTRFAPTIDAPLLLATDHPINRMSEFHHPSWFSPNRPCADFSVAKARPGRPDALSQGDVATASFLIRAPASPGRYDERFTLVLEGVESLSSELGFELTVEVAET